MILVCVGGISEGSFGVEDGILWSFGVYEELLCLGFTCLLIILRVSCTES